MHKLTKLFKNNRDWVKKMCAGKEDFFRELATHQNPQYLWIGCSDSRVPANEIVGLMPGDLFVHRNVANLIIHTDMNCLSVLQYAVDLLKVKHVIVCGHYGCGGIKAAFENTSHGLIDNWLRHIQDIHHKHNKEISRIETVSFRIDRLCELNVKEQVINVCNTTIIQDAWKRKQNITVHGWIYDIKDGLLKDLKISIASKKELSVLLQPLMKP